MKGYLDIDAVGRVVLPKAVRERYGITQGGRVEIIDTGQGVLLRPQASAPSVTHLANGFPVLQPATKKEGGTRAPVKMDTTDLVDLVTQSRSERDARNVTATDTEE